MPSNPLTRPLELILIYLNDAAMRLPLPDSISSWAMAIVAMAVLVKLVTQPLTSRQQASMRRMQEVQPKLQELQKRYKDDREKLAQAQMELYKTEGVNPFGGCLPLIIQMVVLIGLWRAIMNLAGSAEMPGPMAGEPFLWVPDLSLCEPSPLCGAEFSMLPLAVPILLIAMVVSQMLYQRFLTPPSQSSDPQQQMMAQMTKFMPLLFAWIFIKFPAGLVLYYATFNIVGVLQFGGSQWLKRDKSEQVPALATAGGDGGDGDTPAVPKEERGTTDGGRGRRKRRARK